jgi:hypothetical protein
LLVSYRTKAVVDVTSSESAEILKGFILNPEVYL